MSSEPMRYRIVGGRQAEHVYDLEEARARAHELASAVLKGIAVCEAPLGGLVRHLFMVKPPAKPAKG